MFKSFTHKRSCEWEINPPSERANYLLFLLWFQDLLSLLVLIAISAAFIGVVYKYAPLLAGYDLQSTTPLVATLPDNWPLEEVSLPVNCNRTLLPMKYWNTRPVYVIPGERYKDPNNPGSFPLHWAVAFTSKARFSTVFNHYYAELKWPLYRVIRKKYTATSTRAVFEYVDGDHFVIIEGPGPESKHNKYLLRILAYDN